MVTASRRLALIALPLAIGLGAGACEIIAGIEDVNDARDGGSSTSTGETCAPVDAGCDGACAAETFITGLEAPIGLALHDGVAYWAEMGKVTGVTLAAKADAGSWKAAGPESVVADESGIYWGHYYTECVGHAPLDGGPSRLLGACEGTYGGQIALDADHVYVAVDLQNGSTCTGPDCCGPDDTGCVLRIPKKGGAAMYYAQGELTSRALAVNETHVYWGALTAGEQPGPIKRCPKQGCSGAPEIFSQGPWNASAMSADAEHLYWIDAQGGRVVRQRLDDPGGQAETFGSSIAYGRSILVDDTYVVWTDTHDVYRMLKKSPGTPERLGGADPSRLAGDCSHVYWTERSAGTILRVHR